MRRPLFRQAALERLSSPQKIQAFLNATPINHELDGETVLSVREVIRQKRAHCIEGAMLAACALWVHGDPPLVVHLDCHESDYPHVIAVFRRHGAWGALSKTNGAPLRYRDPIYRTLRELSLAYGDVDAAALRGLHAVPTLESLDLGGTEVTAATLQALPRTLTRLVLGNCRKIGQDFGDALAKATPQLRALDLSHSSHLEDACLQSLRSVASLRELDLSWCEKLTRDAAGGLAALTQLERLTLKGWNAFDAEQWAKLRAMPNLEVLENDRMRETLRK